MNIETYPTPNLASLDTLVRAGTLTESHAATLADHVGARKNILVVGPTCSGRTTVVQALLDKAVKQRPADHVAILETTRELHCVAERQIRISIGAGGVTPVEAVRTVWRRAVSRIVLDELRGPEAHEIAAAWTTGIRGGLATMNAQNAVMALRRFEELARLHAESSDNSTALVRAAVDVVITMVERRVTEVVCV